MKLSVVIGQTNGQTRVPADDLGLDKLDADMLRRSFNSKGCNGDALALVQSMASIGVGIAWLAPPAAAPGALLAWRFDRSSTYVAAAAPPAAAFPAAAAPAAAAAPYVAAAQLGTTQPLAAAHWLEWVWPNQTGCQSHMAPAASRQEHLPDLAPGMLAWCRAAAAAAPWLWRPVPLLLVVARVAACCLS